MTRSSTRHKVDLQEALEESYEAALRVNGKRGRTRILTAAGTHQPLRGKTGFGGSPTSIRSVSARRRFGLAADGAVATDDE
jgi:hypothetical protein